MSEPEKFFIVTTLDNYTPLIRRYRLDPGRCFYCWDMREATRDVLINASHGISAAIVTTEGIHHCGSEWQRAA